ncbi:MAG: serine/threonine-protein kinase [Polyangiales bacterium]
MRECPKCHKRFLESNARVCDTDGAVLDLVVVASDRDRLVGTTILNRYAVDKVLGDGGMGVVYRAIDTETRRPYAVKVLRAEYSEEEDLVIRFEQEARAAASVRNPHIVEIFDWGSLPDGSRFFVMEYLEGRSLGDLLARMPKAPGADRRQPLPEDFALHISMQIAEGLKAAHEIGIVHRDIKPDNFHIVRKPEDPYFVKILDFGIAKVQNSKAARTRTGSVFGTPHYMSPEQASGDKNIDATTDIYGLGVMMYEMVVGKIPFDADNLMGILTAHLYHTPTPPSIYPECEKLSRSFEAIILKCLAKDREARYLSMGELHDDLARCRRGETSLALEDQEVSTRRFDRSDFVSEAATVIRQLPAELLQPASPEELNAALGFQTGSPQAHPPTSGPPSGPSQAAPAAHSMSLPSPPPSSQPSPMMNSLAPPAMASPLQQQQPPSPFDQVGKIRFADPNAAPPELVTHASLPPGTEVPRPRSKTGLIVGAIIGFGVFIAIGIIAFASALQSPPAQPPHEDLALTQQQLQPGRVAATNQQPAAPATPQPAVDAQAPAVPHGVPQAQAEPVLIVSNVAGARVFRGGVQVGTAPHTVARPAVGEETYTVSAEGFQDQVVIVTPATQSPVSVTLPAAAAPEPRDRHGRVRPHRERPPLTNAHPPRTGQPPTRRTGDLQDPWNQ